MKLIEDFCKLYNTIKCSNTYIRSNQTKNLLRDFYEKSWLPVSKDFQTRFGNKMYNSIEKEAYSLYGISKKDYFRKEEIIPSLRKIEGILEEIKFNIIRKFGTVIESETKKDIIKTLEEKGFKKVIDYIQKSEKHFRENENSSKESCYQARLAIEEFFREIRERISGQSIDRGTLGDHINYLEKNKKMISYSERQLIQNGFYAFLSEKGNHATKEEIVLEDAKVSIYIFYILVEYILEKLKSFV